MIAAATAAFLAVFIAEFGDKSQLVTLTLACRYPAGQVLAGAMAAFALVLGIAVGVGGVIAAHVPHGIVAIVSGLFFIVVGIFNWRSRSGESCDESGNKGFFQTLAMISLAEFGDKTQLAAMFITASMGYPLAVFGGAMVALFINHLLAVYLGSRFLSRLNPQYLKIGTSLLFIAIGLFMLIYEAGVGF